MFCCSDWNVCAEWSEVKQHSSCIQFSWLLELSLCAHIHVDVFVSVRLCMCLCVWGMHIISVYARTLYICESFCIVSCVLLCRAVDYRTPAAAAAAVTHGFIGRRATMNDDN